MKNLANPAVIKEILSKNEIFRIWLDRDCFKSSKWKYMCNQELFDMRKQIPKKYNKPMGNDYYQIYSDGKFFRASREDCIGLEYTAAWTELGVIQRLNYSFFGKELPDNVKKDLPIRKKFYKNPNACVNCKFVVYR